VNNCFLEGGPEVQIDKPTSKNLVLLSVFILTGFFPLVPTEVYGFLYDLSVNISGSGSVRDTGMYIACPGDCNEAFVSPTSVTLRAYPESGQRFSHWSGSLNSTSNPATLLVDGVYSVMAYFSANTPPAIDSLGSCTVNENERIRRTISASDADGDILHFSASNLPEGATFVGQTFSWTPTYAQAGTYIITFVVSDGDAVASKTMTVTVVNVNHPPLLTMAEHYQATETVLLTIPVVGQDPDSDPLTYGATSLPTGASFDTFTTPPLFSWTPTFDQAGTYEAAFFVSDGTSMAYASTTITVNNLNQPPMLNPIGNHRIMSSATLSFSVTATDPDMDPLMFRAESLPSGASFSAESAVFQWTPHLEQVGSHFITFEVSDGSLMDQETATVFVYPSLPLIPDPLPAQQLYPGQGAVGIGPDDLCFSWPAAQNATLYDLYVSRDPLLASVEHTIRDLNEPLFCVDASSGPRPEEIFLAPYQCYFWTVVARNVYGAAAYPVFGFVTDAQGEVCCMTPTPFPDMVYDMISFPLYPSNPDPVAVLKDELGPYDPSRWRLFWYSPKDTAYHEYPDVPDVTPDIGYWLITTWDTPLSANGFPVSMEKNFVLSIPPGYVQIGCPFPFPVAWREVWVRNGAFTTLVTAPQNIWTTPVLWKYENNTYVPSDLLEPWRGYWIQNVSDQTVELLIPARMFMPGEIEAPANTDAGWFSRAACK